MILNQEFRRLLEIRKELRRLGWSGSKWSGDVWYKPGQPASFGSTPYSTENAAKEAGIVNE